MISSLPATADFCTTLQMQEARERYDSWTSSQCAPLSDSAITAHAGWVTSGKQGWVTPPRALVGIKVITQPISKAGTKSHDGGLLAPHEESRQNLLRPVGLFVRSF
jgi:hypothetical protein